MHFWQKCHWSDAVFFSLHSIRWHMISMYSITRELWTVNFEQLIKLVPAFFPDMLLNATIPPSTLLSHLKTHTDALLCSFRMWHHSLNGSFLPITTITFILLYFSLGSRLVNIAQELWGLLVDIISKHVNGLVWRQEDVIATQVGELRSHAWPCSWSLGLYLVLLRGSGLEMEEG